METGAVVKKINPASEIKFVCRSQSYQKTSGEIISLVMTNYPKEEVHLISYNQADDTITTIRNYGSAEVDSESESDGF